MYVVVERNPCTRDLRVLYPRRTLAPVHQDLESAKQHRESYIREVYVEDPDAGRRRVSVYSLHEALVHETRHGLEDASIRPGS